MRILALSLAGFGPYRGEQHIDFRDFERDGLFAITGRTGAGKSTILDAIVFALFDRVPRYEGSDKSVRSHHCAPQDPTRVVLELEVDGVRYRVTRTPSYERPSQRGSGLTVQSADARLDVWSDDGAWQPIEVKPREVGRRIGEIVRLNAGQFLQVVLLAQGRFADFLQAGTADRRTVLRSLFGTARYEDLEKHVHALARTAEQEVGEIDRELGDLVAQAADVVGADTPAVADRAVWFGAQGAALTEALTAARAAREAAEIAAGAAVEALERARRGEDARRRRDAARAAVASLEARSEEIEGQRASVAAARAAEPVTAAARSVSAARVAVGDAEAGVREAAAGVVAAGSEVLPAALWPAELVAAASGYVVSGSAASSAESAGAGLSGAARVGGPDASGSDAVARGVLAPAALRTRVAELASAEGALREALAAEAALPQRERAVAAADGALARASVALAEVLQRQAGAPSEKAALEARLAAESAEASTLEVRLEGERAAQALVAAHRQVVTLAERLAVEREREGAASAAARLAVGHHDDLVQARLRGESARLAETLAAGEPCPVCGALEHPRPAAAGEETVTDEGIAAAREAADGARAALATATAAAEATAAALGSELEAATGTKAYAAARLAAASGAVAAARAQATAQAATQAAIAELVTRMASDQEHQTELAVAQTQAQGAVEAARQALEDARGLVMRVRGAAPSVGALRAALVAARGSIACLADARDAEAAALATLAAAEAALAGAVAASPFESEAQAAAGALDRASIDRYEAEIAAFTDELAAARGALAEASAAEIPAEVADLGALEAAQREAEAGQAGAIEVAVLAGTRAGRFAALVTAFESAAAGSVTAREHADVGRSLAATLEGKEPNTMRMRLESFVLAARLESIVDAANLRLVTMSSGQYRLVTDDARQYRNVESGLGLRVYDTHTGTARATASLSGGETFLASLALALGLAETVSAEAGGIRLDTLFIDEGFGALDPDTLAVAMSTLEDLRTGGRTIGLISHVEAMKEDIPAQLEVRRLADGSSAVRTRVPGA